MPGCKTTLVIPLTTHFVKLISSTPGLLETDPAPVLELAYVQERAAPDLGRTCSESEAVINLSLAGTAPGYSHRRREVLYSLGGKPSLVCVCVCVCVCVILLVFLK